MAIFQDLLVFRDFSYRAPSWQNHSFIL